MEPALCVNGDRRIGFPIYLPEYIGIMNANLFEAGDSELDPLSLIGVPGSPYTRKMVAVLRYRRIPYRLIFSGREPADFPTSKVRLLPTFYLPGADGRLEAVTDSTPLIRRFEREYEGRSVRPANPVLAFLDSLLEDYGDEWLTKAMFHYRWAYRKDIDLAAGVLPSWGPRPLDDEALATVGKAIAERQISRLRYVGSSPRTGPMIEDSYVRFIDLFERHLSQHRYLFGGRPGAGDFAVFGQLTQLVNVDPTPMAVAAARAPRLFAWVGLTDDLCGLEPGEADWFDPAALPDTLLAILKESGRVYPPLLLANAAAATAGEATVETTIDGHAWSQQTFPYQVKCLAWLRAEYEALSAGERTMADAALAGTGWAALFSRGVASSSA